MSWLYVQAGDGLRVFETIADRCRPLVLRPPLILLMVLTSIADPGSASAQESEQARRAWTIEMPARVLPGLPEPPSESEASRLVQIVLDQHPELTDARADVSRESGLRFQATRRPNPSLGYAASEVGNDGTSGQQGVYVSQQWVTGGKLDMQGQIGAWKTTAASERLSLARLRLISRVKTQYWRMVAARHRVALLNELEALLEDGVQISQTLHEAAEVGLGPVLQAKLERSQISVARRQGEADSRARTSALAATLGVPVDFLQDVGSDPWPEPLSAEEIDAFQPWTASPELAEAHALIEAARWSLRLAQSQIISNVDSFASLQHDAATDNMILSLQIGMAIPIHDRKGGLIRAAQAELAQSEAQYARRWRDLQTRWAEAVGNYRSAVEMVSSIEQELLGLAEERLALARQAHQQGELDYLELLTAQRSFLTIRQANLDAAQQAVVAAVSLETLVVESLR